MKNEFLWNKKSNFIILSRGAHTGRTFPGEAALVVNGFEPTV